MHPPPNEENVPLVKHLRKKCMNYCIFLKAFNTLVLSDKEHIAITCDIVIQFIYLKFCDT